MDNQKVTAMSIGVEIEGEPYIVLLKDVNIQLLVQMVGVLTPGGVMKVVAAPQGMRFTTIGKINQG